MLKSSKFTTHIKGKMAVHKSLLSLACCGKNIKHIWQRHATAVRITNIDFGGEGINLFTAKMSTKH